MASLNSSVLCGGIQYFISIFNAMTNMAFQIKIYSRVSGSDEQL